MHRALYKGVYRCQKLWKIVIVLLKKLYTGAVISAIAATGLVGTIGTAHADTVRGSIAYNCSN